MLHVRYQNTSHDFSIEEAKISAEASDVEIKQAAAQLLDIDISRFDDMVVSRRPSGDIVVHPEAVYG